MKKVLIGIRDGSLKNRAIGLVAAGFLVVGCTSTPTLQEIEKFGIASKSLASDTVVGINLVNETVVERKMYDVALVPAKAPVDADFEGIITKENRAVRVDAVEQLGRYADGLRKLAAADVKGEVSAAATELDGALNGLASTLGKEAEAKAAIGLITTAISEIGQRVVEEKKRKAIKVIIKEAHPYVEQVGILVSKEFSLPDADADADVSLLAFGAVKSIRRQEAQLKGVYQDSSKEMSFDKRLASLENIRDKHNFANSTEVFFEKVSLGAGQMVQAHAKLEESVSKDSFSSRDVVAAVSDLITTATALKKVLDGMSL